MRNADGGRDCSAIPNVDKVRCRRGQCFIGKGAEHALCNVLNFFQDPASRGLSRLPMEKFASQIYDRVCVEYNNKNEMKDEPLSGLSNASKYKARVIRERSSFPTLLLIPTY